MPGVEANGRSPNHRKAGILAALAASVCWASPAFAFTFGEPLPPLPPLPPGPGIGAVAPPETGGQAGGTAPGDSASPGPLGPPPLVGSGPPTEDGGNPPGGGPDEGTPGVKNAPEPATLAMGLLGCGVGGGISLIRRRRRR